MTSSAIIVPAVNEAATIGDVLECVLKRLHTKRPLIVVVDNCSTDDTAEVARKFTRHVISTGEQPGNGVAMKAGLDYLRSLPDSDRLDYVIRIDADGQHDPDIIQHMYAALAEHDMVVFSRFHPQSNVSEAPPNRIDLNRAAARAMSLTTGLPCTDARSGYAGWRYHRLAPIIGDLKTVGYGPPIEFTLRMWRHAMQCGRPLSYYELPHAARYRRDINGQKLQKKLLERWAAESSGDHSDRWAQAKAVFMNTCEELGIEPRWPDDYSNQPLVPVVEEHVLYPDRYQVDAPLFANPTTTADAVRRDLSDDATWDEDRTQESTNPRVDQLDDPPSQDGQASAK